MDGGAALRQLRGFQRRCPNTVPPVTNAPCTTSRRSEQEIVRRLAFANTPKIITERGRPCHGTLMTVFGKSEDRLTVAVAPCFSYPCEMPVKIDIFHPHREAFSDARAHVRLPLTITSIHEFVGGEMERTSLDSAPAPWHGLKTRLQITKEKTGRSTTRPTGIPPLHGKISLCYLTMI